MQPTVQVDDLIMGLVEGALARPQEEREAYLRNACGDDSTLFRQAWTYIQWEERMGNFLLDPVCSLPEHESPFRPGQLIMNRFRIVREVARGGMGVVWQAWDQKLDRTVAIKSAKAGLGKRLPPEVLHASEISHPNVCKTFEIHTAYTPEGEVDFISMEFLEGETLSARLRQGPLPKGEALAIALQLCDGLSEAHRKGIIHGDLKSSNVILAIMADGSVRAVITDFGLARRPNASEQDLLADVLAGTPAYMAPELWKGAKPSVATDIYALGVVLWELISGQSPNDLGVTATTLSWSERPKWKPPGGYGKKWDRVLARCLETDPEHRFKSAEEVAQALGPSLTRKRLLTAAAAAILAIVTGVMTYQIVTAPPETARLALLPFSADHYNENLLRGTASRLAHIKGTSRMGFKFIPVEKVLRKHADTPDKAHAALGATHVLWGELEKKPQTTTLHAYLTDTRNGVNVKEWTADYKPEELRYVPTALAGVVTNALHLPLAETPKVNAAARKDYLAGVSAVRYDSRIGEALTDFERAVAADGDSPLPYAGLAEAQRQKYYLSGDKQWLGRARESLRQADIRNPDLAQVHYVAGILKANIGQLDQAIAEYLRVIELEPRHSGAYWRLGSIYEQNHQLEKALTALRKAVEIDPQYYKNHRQLGLFYFRQANYEEALKHYRTAVALAPQEPLIHFDLAEILKELGRFRDAEQELRQSLRLGKTPEALLELGLVLIYQRREAQAIPIIQSGLNLRPKQSSDQYLRWMDLGTAYRRTGLAHAAKQAYRRGLDLAEANLAENPRDDKIRSHLAYLAAQLGERRRAEFEIAQALQQSPDNNYVLWTAAITYEVLGHREDALAVLARSPYGVIAQVGRWPDAADLRNDPRFLQLLTAHIGK
jgi:serine/threonine protein kinase/Flp pilus assembly protein TadD